MILRYNCWYNSHHGSFSIDFLVVDLNLEKDYTEIRN